MIYDRRKDMKKKLLIEGMSCGHCVAHVEEALKELDGITSVSVSLEEKNAVIEGTNEIAEDTVSKALDEAGYELVRIENLA
jgi:copper ion binding protein